MNRIINKIKINLLILSQLPRFVRQFYIVKKEKNPRFAINMKDVQLCLRDATLKTEFDQHYIFHTAWAARVLKKTQPMEHVDISSSLYFVTNVSAFVPIKFFDFRPAEISLPGLVCESADICSLPFEDGTVQSLSCMHVVEHVGLGRYGDLLDYNADIRAINEIKRVVQKGGDVIFAVPVAGIPRIVFNAHRVYSYKQIIEMFDGFEIMEFALVPDEGGFVEGANEVLADRQRYGCGCFWLKKL